MSKLKVIRASAGSGKTYRITAEYLRLLFRYPRNYVHILAVTFTNKATGEMKNRVISDLYKLSRGEHSSYAGALVKEFNLSPQELQEKAGFILNGILHNYSRFTITTIDSFFQRIIKSFAREAGLQFNFNIELDTGDVIEKASDQILSRLENDKLLLGWLVEFAEERIEQGKGWDFKNEILSLGRELFNEAFQSFPLSFHQKLNDREWLKGLQKQLFAIRNAFESKLVETGREGMSIINSYNLTPDDFKYKAKGGGVGQFFLKLSQGDDINIGKRITEAMESVENWLPDDKGKAAVVRSAAGAGLFSLLQQAVNYYIENYTIYRSCAEVLSGFYTLGIMADLSAEISNYAESNNLFILANTGVFLKSIIGENDAPFIYEKTGQVFNHFMIDEFQDTSGIQWQNFQPLIKNSLSENHDCMIVGDVKQSIYRWRNTDWKIMARQIDNDFSGQGIYYDTLSFNWRSKANIVAFNNTFFNLSSQELQRAFNENIDNGNQPAQGDNFITRLISDAYNDCMQKLPSGRKSDEGFVKIQFVDNEDKDWKNKVLPLLPGIIGNLLLQGHSLKSIAILVRTSTDGHLVADYLNSYKAPGSGNTTKNYQVLSSESTFLKNAPVILFLVKLFKYIITPDDSINTTSLVYDYQFFFNKNNAEYSNSSPESETSINESAISADDLQSMFPPEFINNIETLKYYSPDELLERLTGIFRLNEKVPDLPFLQAFHDFIMDFINVNPSGIAEFLEYWDEKKDTLSVSVTEEQDAIRVLTIHKAKGLEFTNVIIPFCNWNIDHNPYNRQIIWCQSNEKPFSGLEFFPLRYSSGLKDTVFAGQYFLEKAQAYVDNLNLMYVAFTRATDNLFVFSPLPSNDEKLTTTGELIHKILPAKVLQKENGYTPVDISIFWNGNENIFEYGKLNKPGRSEVSNVSNLPLDNYNCFEIKEKLRQHYSATGFWDEDENKKPPMRVYGNLMHRLFQNIRTTSDIENAVDMLIFNGLIKENEKTGLINEVKSYLSEMPFSDWFSGSWQVMNEAGIVVPNLHQYRPDRIMMKENKTLVIDYKFGKIRDARYNLQVKHYVEYLKEMGYTKTEGVIWYVNLNLVEKVE